eukprot:CAMPEP_0118971646 /NCGR_PEP_ID=MMETSP1173-20130426/8209_1 /TAXON_ID=1034831 /ORGANISM="Rhizochromulina marina cf, Strain CCMP1243" /LENGTH=295 /DNA_ID=CAMNT_0006921119 /DNA_START=3 /DNA_END=890 /DNA_ORIENTATION=-
MAVLCLRHYGLWANDAGMADVLALNLTARVETLVGWLNSNPVGLKLHAPLARELSRPIVHLFTWQSQLLRAVAATSAGAYGQHLGDWPLVCFLALSGAAPFLALCLDLIELVALPVTLVALCFTGIFRCASRVFYSMLLLLQGRKFNVLRGRIDSCSPSTPLYLLGMLLLTALAFTFTTILLFAALAWCFRVAILSVQFLVWCLLSILDGFPWASCLLRFLTPRSFPWTITFAEIGATPPRTEGSHLSPEQEPSVVRLTSIPMPLSHVIHPHALQVRRALSAFFEKGLAPGPPPV